MELKKEEKDEEQKDANHPRKERKKLQMRIEEILLGWCTEEDYS